MPRPYPDPGGPSRFATTISNHWPFSNDALPLAVADRFAGVQQSSDSVGEVWWTEAVVTTIIADLLCVGITLLALALPPADAIQATLGDLNREGTCYWGQFTYADSPYFDKGMVAQVPASNFNSGKGCGTCYQVTCKNSPSCTKGSVMVRAVGLSGGFNLNFPAWDKIVKDRNVGNVEIDYRSVDCPSSRTMAVRIENNSNVYNFVVQILGAAKSGGVEKVEISNDGKQWKSMTNNGWGATWVLNPAKDVVDKGRKLSVRVTAVGGGQQVVLLDVIPSKWSAGKTYESGTNF
ncbi:unnamed protein product [Closterium sp. Naga37s-1]|nr:unnamed protein product [Closterium sp. Naga37s-1]